jgi:pSer/pThr/pTyr-binding forkhead associated (FHA) protein
MKKVSDSRQPGVIPETVLVRILRVGRSRDNDVVIVNAQVSSAHARLYGIPDRWFLEDCGSTNGTTVDGTRIPAEVPFEIFPGDSVTLGAYSLPVPPKARTGKREKARSLRDWIRETGAVGLGEAMPILRQIAEVLAFEHDRKLVRPELSAKSILLVGAEGALRILPTDPYGRIGHPAARLGGAPEYAPPEQFRGMPLNVRRDVYALGVLTFEMLAGRLPFRASSPQTWAKQHASAVPPRLEGVPEAVAAVVEKALQKDPKDRYPSVRALLVALLAASAEEPPPNKPDRRVMMAGAVRPPPPPPRLDASTCPSCGSHVGDVAVFCTQCGTCIQRANGPGPAPQPRRASPTGAASSPAGSEGASFYATWPLAKCRDVPQTPALPHQTRALKHLRAWHARRGEGLAGGILVLPTGGGKTFTAVRFLAEGPLSEGCKVLWLAHTHHLLEQAFKSFRPETLGTIREPRRDLRLRVVSGTDGHFAPESIDPTDDVVIGTLQTVTNAVREKKAALRAFLRSAGKKRSSSSTRPIMPPRRPITSSSSSSRPRARPCSV